MTTLPNAAVPICCTCLSEKKVRVVLFGTGKPAYQFPYLKVDDKYIAYLCEECVDLFALIRVLKENRKAKYEDNDKLYPFSVEHKNTIVSRFIRRPSPTILCASEAGQNQSSFLQSVTWLMSDKCSFSQSVMTKELCLKLLSYDPSWLEAWKKSRKLRSKTERFLSR
jgi:hypothetical protein